MAYAALPEMPQMTEPSMSALPDWFVRNRAQPGVPALVDIDGAAIHYLSWGMEHGERPALLFIHGFRAHAGWWDFLAPFFIDRYRVVAMDFSGMGDSEHRRAYSVEGFAAEINGVIEALGLGPVTAVGHSYGGARLLRACAERPELYRQLIVVDSYIRFRDEAGPTLPKRLQGNRIYPHFDEACARFRLMPEQPGALPFLLCQVAEHALRKVDGGWCWKFDPAMATDGDGEIDGEDLLARVAKPVDFIYGEHSKVVSHERAARIVGYLPHVRGPLMMPGSHHHLMLDNPLALVATLLSLLASPL